MKNMKKLLALLLAIVMVMGMFPVGTLAQEREHDHHAEGCTGDECALEDCGCRCHYRHLDTCLEGCTGELSEDELCDCDCHFIHLTACTEECTGTIDVEGEQQECACECHDHNDVCVENCVGETKDGEACDCSCHHTEEDCTLDCADEECACACHEAVTQDLEETETCATCGSEEHVTENHPKEEAKDETKCATCNSTEHTTENHPKEEAKDEVKCGTCQSTEHTTENHPEEEAKDEVKCATCQSTEHATADHPAEPAKCEKCGSEEHATAAHPTEAAKCEKCDSTEHTTENHPKEETKCGICQGSHADADCTYCLLCKVDNSQCVICEECGTHAGDHTSTCTKRPCEICGESPCVCIPEEEPEETDDLVPYESPVFFDNAAAFKKEAAPKYRTWARGAALDDPTLFLDKKVTANTNGTYTLTLESYVTGDAVTNETGIPLDIVLVMDTSGSMDYCMYCGDDDSDVLRGMCSPATSGIKSTGPLYGLIKTKTYYYYKTVNNEDGTKDTEAIAIKYCSECKVWAITTSNHFSGTKHTDDCFIPVDGTNYTAAKTLQDNERLKNKDGNYLDTYVRVFRTPRNKGNADCEMRLVSVKSSVNSFLQLIYEDANGKNLDHRIAMVTFANHATLHYKNGTSVSKQKLADTITDAQYKAAYFSARNDATLIDDVVENLAKAGNTYTDDGLKVAYNVLAKNEIPLSTDKNDRQRLVVLVTDGSPVKANEDAPSSTFSNGSDAINEAKRIKALKDKPKIYGIGIFAGANASNPGDLPDHNTVVTDSTQKFFDRCNRFMHCLSSNYPNATATGLNCNITPGAIDSNLNGKSYYLSAGTTEQLEAVFTSIFESITDGTVAPTLDATSYIKDVITQSFMIPEGATVSAKAYKFKGYNTAGTPQWETNPTSATYTPIIDSNNKRIVTVSGFNYTQKAVGYNIETKGGVEISRTPKGEKIVLTIPIMPNPDFLGGNSVPTNEGTAGVYKSDGNAAEYFYVPKLNIPVKEIQPAFKTGNIYLGEAAMIPHIANVGHFQYVDGGKTLDGTTNGTNNGYADIIYTISDASGNNSIRFKLENGIAHSDHGLQNWTAVKGNLNMNPLLYDDTTYKVTAQVVPSISQSEAEVDDAGQAPFGNGVENEEDRQIQVFKPYITFHDSTMNYGETANYEGENSANTVTKNLNRSTDIVWKHIGKDAAGNDVVELPEESTMGPAPTLTFTYAPALENDPYGKFRLETSVQITGVTPSNTTVTGTTSDPYDHKVPEVPAGQDPQNLVHEVFFYRDVCGFDGCEQAAEDAEVLRVEPDKEENAVWTNFVVHLNTFDLTITKQGADMAADPHVSFIFRVTGPYEFSQDVVIYGNGSVTLKDLPGGDYTVTELTDWSWRYELDEETPNGQIGNGTVNNLTFINNREEIKWLDGNAYSDNAFDTVTATPDAS